VGKNIFHHETERLKVTFEVLINGGWDSSARENVLEKGKV